LRNIWPNEDGREWTYRVEQREWNSPGLRIYPTEAEVPPLPSLEEVAALLGNHPIGPNPVNETAGYRMRFDGIKTTQSGATGQNLETELFDLGSGTARLAHAGAAAPGFVRALARARPDLREKIARRWPEAARVAAAPVGPASVFEPFFLFGYAFEKTREYIGSYGDLNLDLAWKYLEADLRPGSEFSMQLVPDLADNVFLHVRVIREGPTATALGTIPRSIEVLYLVDFGVSFATDEEGNVFGYFTAYTYGTITYAPRVGPIASYSRNFVQPGQPLDPGSHDQRIGVTAVSPGRTRPTTGAD
jgi:hypothetical protein